MSFYRKLVAHCDGQQYGSRCFSSEVLDPNTAQPYVDLLKLGWTIDGDKMYCPKHSEGTG